ncbi:MAG: di-trans,poly-cis-decaprenylcistransferase [Clostridia bacterium]|nr:di-trans,poly-cis-decaprenylcistransferase [Clostridia bacterium]
MRYTDAELETFGLGRETIPRHVAIIMDGNGRWAKARGQMRSAGHRAGVNALRDIIRFSSDAGVEALTVYAFSTENQKRPPEEIGVLCGLLIEYFRKEIDELDENRVRIRSIGDLSWFPQAVQEAVKNAEARTAKNEGLKLNIALNYGSQAEIVRAMQLAAASAAAEGRAPTQADFEANLYTAGLPPVDLLIRTSGEERISNFLLYQLAYAELYFTDVYWPDFTRAEYIRALTAFAGRSRRFGGLSATRRA